MHDDLGIIGIDHVGVAAPDLEAAVAFHVGTLGLRELHREANEVMGVVEVMLGTAPEDSAGTQIQLLAPLGPDSPIQRFLDRAGPGIQHLAYRVRNVDDAARVLREKGFRLLYDAARPGTRGSRINFVHPKDAGGVLMELVQSAELDASGPASPAVDESRSRAADPGGSRHHSYSHPDPASDLVLDPTSGPRSTTHTPDSHPREQA